MKTNKEYFCAGWNRIFKWDDLVLKAQNSCYMYQLYVLVIRKQQIFKLLT